MKSSFEYLRTLVLGIGVISAWQALIQQFAAFIRAYGTLLHPSAALATNPFLTPCLYGSIAFLIAFLWSAWLNVYPNRRSEVWLQRLLIFGVVFAAVVVSYEFCDYYGIVRLGTPLTCSPGAFPAWTPCFRGLIFFILAFLAGLWQIRHRSVVAL